MRWLLLPPPSLLAAPTRSSTSSSSSSSSSESWESKRGVVLAASACVLCASAAFAIYQLTKILFSVVRDSEYEADKLITAVSATIHSDSPEVPEELVMYDDIEDVYTYGSLQELFYRRSVGGDTDWEWSFDMDEWYSTADLAPNHTFILDPPSIIFIARLHLTSVARRKYAAAAGRGIANGSSSSSQKQPSRIPPPVELPEWAQQQQAEHLAAAGHGSSSNGASKDSSRGQQPSRRSHDSSGSSSSAAGGSRGDTAIAGSAAAATAAAAGGRRLDDAPDLLCCPITGQIMLQPVSLPSGKTFEYETVRRWITQHGTDPTTCEPLSILDVHPNLLLREMVEKWLAGADPLADHAADY